MTVGDRIKKKREKKGISQTDLAEMVGISKQTLYKYENNIITNIPSDKIEKIAEKLDTSASHLMGWKEQDYLYKDENVEFLIEVTKVARYEEFVDTITKYMSLAEDDKKSVNDMIEFLYEKESKRDDN